MKTLIALVGENPAHVLVAARSLGVTSVCLVATERTEGICESLTRQLQRPPLAVPATAVQRIIYDEDPSWSVIAADLIELIVLQPNEEVWLDITGGTKPMALGAWQGLRQRAPGLRTIYLGARGLEDADTGRPLNLAALDLPLLTPSEFLSWRKPAAVMESRWEGHLRQPRPAALQELYERLPLSSWFFEHYAQITQQPRYDDLRRAGRLGVPTGTPLPSVPPRFRWRQGELTEPPGSEYFQKHIWLEEYGFCTAIDALTPAERHGVVGCVGLRGLEHGTACVEVDGVLVRGHRICAIEAKAGKMTPDVIYQSAARLKGNLSQHARLIFLAPHYRLNPPGASSGHFQAIQVEMCWEKEQFQQAIRRALGF